MTPLNPPRRRSPQAAFTILEILIVIAILGLLVGLTLTKFTGIFGNSQQDVARIFVSTTLKPAFDTYRIDLGNYPSTAEGLAALKSAPAGKTARWRGPYVLEDAQWPPVDPWSNPYQYQFPGKHNTSGYDLWSMGPDNESGTADDIGNWLATASETEK